MRAAIGQDLSHAAQVHLFFIFLSTIFWLGSNFLKRLSAFVALTVDFSVALHVLFLPAGSFLTCRFDHV